MQHHSTLSGIRGQLQSAAPSWVNENVIGIVSSLKLAGGITTALASGLGSSQSRFNPYRFTSLMGFMATQSAGVYYKETPHTEEQKAQEAALSPLAYISKRIGNGFQPSQHILQTQGLGTIATGLALLPSYRFEADPKFAAELTYTASNLISGSSLLLAKNPDTAWQISSGTQLAIMPFQLAGFWDLMRNPANADAAWKGKWLFTSASLFTAANLIGLTLGGNKHTSEIENDGSPFAQVEADTMTAEKHSLKETMRR